jgi:hypothetical protein
MLTFYDGVLNPTALHSIPLAISLSAIVRTRKCINIFLTNSDTKHIPWVEVMACGHSPQHSVVPVIVAVALSVLQIDSVGLWE